MGFCVEDWNINMAVAPKAPLHKSFHKTKQIGQVPTWTVLFTSLCCFRRECCAFWNARCTFCHLLDHMTGQSAALPGNLVSFETVWFKVELFVRDFFAAKPSLWKSWLIAGNSHSCNGVESCRGKRHWMRGSIKVSAGWTPHTVLLNSCSVISFLVLSLLLLLLPLHVITATLTPVNPLLTVICQCDNTASVIES